MLRTYPCFTHHWDLLPLFWRWGDCWKRNCSLFQINSPASRNSKDPISEFLTQRFSLESHISKHSLKWTDFDPQFAKNLEVPRFVVWLLVRQITFVKEYSSHWLWWIFHLIEEVMGSSPIHHKDTQINCAVNPATRGR